MGPDTKHTALFLHHHHHIPGHDHMPRLPVIYKVLRFLLLTVIHLCFIHSLIHSLTPPLCPSSCTLLMGSLLV